MANDTIRMALSSIELPEGLEDRLQEKIERSLDMPLREKRVILKPRKRVWLPAFCAAAAVLLFVLGFSALRQARSAQKQNIALVPVAQPGAETSPAPETDTDPLLLYRPVLDKYLEAFGQDEADRYEELGLSSLCLEFAGNPLRSLGFALEDLDGDGAEELIIGTAQNEVYYGTILFDLYSLENGKPVKLAESGKEHVVYDIGNGLLLGNSSSGSGHLEFTLYDIGDSMRAVEKLSFDETHSWVLTIILKDGEEAPAYDPSLTTDEAEDWQHEYCREFIRHDFTPFLSLALNETERTGMEENGRLRIALTEAEERAAAQLLRDFALKTDPFALSDYAAGSPDGVVVLLEQLGTYAEGYGCSREELRGLLYGRENLDAASAEAYAAFLGRLYRLSPKDFLWAWHEAGEPLELMYEVTGGFDPDETARWLKSEWEQLWGVHAGENVWREGDEDLQLLYCAVDGGRREGVLVVVLNREQIPRDSGEGGET